MPSKDIIAAEAENISPSMPASISSASCSNSSTVRTMVPRDVDDLVNEIKLNLRLKSNCTSTASVGNGHEGEKTNAALEAGNGMRAGNNNNGACGGAGGSVLVTCSGRTKMRTLNHRIAPYFVPPRSGTESGCHSCGSPRCTKTCLRQPGTNSSDPYQVLQELLKNGSLISEAVRRISKTEKPIIKCYDYEKDEYDVAAATTTTTTTTTTTSNLIGLEV